MGDALEVKGQNGNVRFDGLLITILRKGYLARATIGKGETEIPLAQVTGVRFQPAGLGVNGSIEFLVPDRSERRSPFAKQTSRAWGDEHSVVFTYYQRQEFLTLRDAVQAALASHDRGGEPDPTSASQPVSRPDVLGRKRRQQRDTARVATTVAAASRGNCANCDRPPSPSEDQDTWRAESDGYGGQHVFCPDCWQQEFGAGN
jgi:Domain of unknown function (DUF4429)